MVNGHVGCICAGPSEAGGAAPCFPRNSSCAGFPGVTSREPRAEFPCCGVP